MAQSSKRPQDDPSSAPESGTVRDEPSGNQPAHGGERGLEDRPRPSQAAEKDDPSVAGEER